MIFKKLLVTIVVAGIVLVMGIVFAGVGKMIPVEVFTGPRADMIKLAILSFCVGLVGVYWLIQVRILQVIAERKKEAKKKLNE